MPKFEVVLELEIVADTPKQAAMVARDMMLDDTQQLLFDVHPFVYWDEAEDYYPSHDRGWQARFEQAYTVRPTDMIEWKKLEST